MKQKGTRLLVLSLGLIMLVSFTVCNIDAANNKVPTVTMDIHTTWTQFKGMAALAKYIDENSAKLGFKLEFNMLPEGDQGDQVIAVRLATGEAADLVAWYVVPNVKSKADLNNFSEITGSWLNNFDPAVLKGATFSNNGKVIGVPLGGVNYNCMIYNKRVFEKAGVKIPTTWAELLNVCKKIRAIGVDPVFLPYKDSWTCQTLNGFVAVANEAKTRKISIYQLMEQVSTNKIHFKDMKTYQNTLKREIDLIKAGYVNKDFLSDTYAQATQAVLDGKAAMTANATWQINEFLKVDPGKTNSDIGCFPIPTVGNDPIPFFSPNAFYVNAKGKNKKLAMKAARFFGSKEAMDVYFSADGSIPLAKGIKVNLPQAIKEIYDMASQPGRSEPNFGDIGKYSKGQYELALQEMVVGGKTPADVANYLDSIILKEATAAKDPNFIK